MYQSEVLKNHLNTSSVIKSQALVLAEWNMNFAENIAYVGNYRNRPLDPETSKYKRAAISYDQTDSANLYTGATDADTVIDAGFLDVTNDTDTQIPASFVSKKIKEKLLYSLDDCFGRFRPRSGINKLRLGLNNNYTNASNRDMSSRPRYYMPDKDDSFKYWTSYRTEADATGAEREYGVSLETVNGQYYIDDAAPFVVYKEQVPANRITVKMQTNVGTVDRGPFAGQYGAEADPLYGYENQTTPQQWKIQYLDSESNWTDAISFNRFSTRSDGSPIIGADGHVEIGYGIILPDEIRPTFKYVGEATSIFSLPTTASVGAAFIVRQNESEVGTIYVWDGNGYTEIVAEYGWQLIESDDVNYQNFVRKLTSPDLFDGNFGQTEFREVKYLRGLRVVATTMNRLNSTLDLIELSPRLVADISDMVESYEIMKTMSDLGVSGLPVGQLLAATGSISLFDSENAFNKDNLSSIIGKYVNKNLKLKFYESIFDVESADYHVPIKTMYADGFPTINSKDRTTTLPLRDLFFYLESLEAPQVVFQNVSLSYAISVLLDSIGFSNYVFRRMPTESDPIIPFFYIPPGKMVSEILEQLAISTQTAMFFDEYNNFVCMSKGYAIPSLNERATDTTLYGTRDQTTGYSENILGVLSEDMKVYNSGVINYSSNYIQKTYGSLKQAYVLDKDKKWIYKPALLWEVPADYNTKSINEELTSQSGYVLSAMPLNSDLSDLVPSVSNGEVINNVIDIGEAVYWIPRYSGYFYANGEIIKFDAVEYSVPTTASGVNATSNATVWISSVQEYQEYFSKLTFNGKIYPTGRVRIFSEPNYEIFNETVSFREGAVAKHGRGQFGTSVEYHTAGVNEYWLGSSAVGGMVHQSPFDAKTEELSWPSTNLLLSQTAGKVDSYANRSSRTGKIKNFLSSQYSSELDGSVFSPDTLQASALVLEGSGNVTDYVAYPKTSSSASNSPSLKNFMTFVHKDLGGSESKMTSFGTRVRIIGKLDSGESYGQAAAGSMTYFTVNNTASAQNSSISGGSGGIAVLLNPETNQGYYFELAALSDSNIDQFDTSDLYNVVFYKVGSFEELAIASNGSSVYADDPWARSQSKGTAAPFASTEVLWKGISNVLVDDGRFTGQSRVLAESATTVYDLAVEYEDFASYRRFYLYLNGSQIATVDDTRPLPIHQSMGVFVRGSSKCMFEHVYAISNNYSENPSSKVDAPINTIFGSSSLTASDAFRKYSLSGVVQSTYLSGISGSGSKFNIFYDEFGTIMREAAHFDIKYDKAYPALYAKMSPTFNKLQGYVISGFRAGAYGAEFLVFNSTDTALVLDETSGNHLRIQGITFTQSGQKELTMDSYFDKTSNLSNIDFEPDDLVSSSLVAKKMYQDIKNSRMTYGKQEFSLDATYVQSDDAARELMAWLTQRITKPRLAMAVTIFSNPLVQLGDVVSVYSKNSDNTDQIVSELKQFVVYAIDHSRTVSGDIVNTLYLSEVPDV